MRIQPKIFIYTHLLVRCLGSQESSMQALARAGVRVFAECLAIGCKYCAADRLLVLEDDP